MRTSVLLLAAALLAGAEDPRPPAVRAWEAPGFAPIHAGVATTRPVDIGTGWSELRFAGVASHDDEAAFLQLNLGGGSGTVEVAAMAVTGEDGGVLLAAPAGAAAVLRLVDARATGATMAVVDGALRVAVPRRTEFAWDVQLASEPLRLRRGMRYDVAVRLRADRAGWPVTSYLMRKDPLRFYAAAGQAMLVETGRLAAAAGAGEVSVPVNLPWPRPGEEFDPAEAVQRLRAVREALPGMRLLVRVGLEPPGWWRTAHPDQLLRWENGRTAGFASPSSRAWRSESGRNLAALVRAVETAFGDALCAWQPSAQSTGEWYYPIWEHAEWGDLDLSPAAVAAWRAFLRTRYRDDAGLSAAWGRAAAIDAAAIPAGAARRAGPPGPLRDPLAQRDLLDLAAFQAGELADALADACRAIRSAAPAHRPVVAYYGYAMELSGCRDGAGHAGHGALGRLLASGEGPDVFAGMVSYRERGPGGSAGLMAPAASIRVHGRAWAVEDDSRTHRSRPDAGFDRTADLSATRRALARQFAAGCAQRSRTWFLDLYGEGWFHDAEVWSDLAAIAAAAGPLEAGPAPSEVAVVVDEAAWAALKPGTALSRPLAYDLRGAVARMGRAASWWLLDDVAAGRLPPQRLVVMANALWLERERRAALRAALAANGATVLWLYAPGWLSERALGDAAAVEELTGVPVAALPWRETAGELAIAGGPGWDLGQHRLRPPAGAAPVLAPAGGEVLGRWEDGTPGCAASTRAGHRAVLLAAPNPDHRLLARLADLAGARRLAAPGVVVDAGDRLLAVSSRAGGEAAAPATAAVVWPAGEAASAPLAPGGVRVLRLDPP